MIGQIVQRLVGTLGYAVIQKDRYRQLRAREYYVPSEDALTEHLRLVLSSLRCLEWVTQGRRRRSEELFTKVLSVKGPLQMCWTVPFKKLHKDGLPMGIRGGRSRGSEMPRAKCSTVLGEENGDLRASATHPKQRSGVLSLYHVDCVFDVGANDGWFHNWVRQKVGFDGLVVSYEPITAQARALEEKAVDDPLWIVRPYALGRHEEIREFHIMESDVFSSFLRPVSTQPNKYVDSNKVRTSNPVRVRTVAAEWTEIAERHNVSRMHLKMDTQGFDLEVFAGAAAVLDAIVTMQSELAFSQLYEHGADYRDAIRTYASAGYTTSTLQPISFDDQLRMIEADGVFVRDLQHLVPR